MKDCFFQMSLGIIGLMQMELILRILLFIYFFFFLWMISLCWCGCQYTVDWQPERSLTCLEKDGHMFTIMLLPLLCLITYSTKQDQSWFCQTHQNTSTYITNCAYHSLDKLHPHIKKLHYLINLVRLLEKISYEPWNQECSILVLEGHYLVCCRFI